MRELLAHSEAETISSGMNFANELRRGDIVACYGDLGSGKTRFIQGICSRFGVREHVTSPTFTIVKEYHGTECMLYHFDFYRMKSEQELREIGFEEYLSGEGICLIEWADKVMQWLPHQRYDVRLKMANNEHSRIISINHILEVDA